MASETFNILINNMSSPWRVSCPTGHPPQNWWAETATTGSMQGHSSVQELGSSECIHSFAQGCLLNCRIDGLMTEWCKKNNFNLFDAKVKHVVILHVCWKPQNVNASCFLQEEMSQVLDAMFEKLCTEGEHIIDQDDDGDNFYVIQRCLFITFLIYVFMGYTSRWQNIFIKCQNMTSDHTTFFFSGTFNISVKVDGADKLVGCYDNKGSFGELALMYNTPRAATIIATSPGALWCLVSKLEHTHSWSTAGTWLKLSPVHLSAGTS